MGCCANTGVLCSVFIIYSQSPRLSHLYCAPTEPMGYYFSFLLMGLISKFIILKTNLQAANQLYIFCV